MDVLAVLTSFSLVLVQQIHYLAQSIVLTRASRNPDGVHSFDRAYL